MTPREIALATSRAIVHATHEIDAFERDPDAERADPRLIGLVLEIRHVRMHLEIASRKAYEILSVPVVAEGNEP